MSESNLPLAAEQILPEEWAALPETVKTLLESYLAQHSRSPLSERESPLTHILDALPIGVAVHAPDGHLVYINQVGITILGTGLTKESNTEQLAEVFQVYSSTTRQLYPLSQLPSNRALAGEQVRVDDVEIHRGGQVIPLEVWATPILDAQQQVSYAIAVFQDIRDRKHYEAEREKTAEALRQSEARFRNMAANVPGAIFRYLLRSDGSDTVLYMSAGCYQLWEIEADVVEKSAKVLWDMIYPEDLPAMYESVMESARTLQPWNWEWRITTPSGKTKWLQAVGRPERHLNGDILWDTLVLDVSDRHEAEHRFQMLAANTPGVIYQYVLRADGSNAMLYVSPGCRDVWELEPQEILHNVELTWQMVDPSDLPAMQASVFVSAESLQPWNWSWRITTPSGRQRWLQASAKPQKQMNGDVIWDGLILDVSDRKQAEEALRESEGRYRLLAQNMNDLVCLHYPDGRYQYVSPSCETLLGYRYDELVGQNPYEFFHPDERDRIYEESHLAALAGKARPITFRMRHKAGHYIWLETLTKPILDATGQVVQLQTTSRDVTERVLAQEQLRYDALHDSLTGLPNRNLLMERLELAIGRSQRSEDYQFAVLFLDLDRFKVINDSLGHLAGDRLLIHIARQLQSIVRNTDLVARLGGDEFVILLEDISHLQDAIRTVERIVTTLDVPLLLEDRQVFTTASIGIVFGTNHYNSASDLLRNADIAMYRAKTKGKARYEIFDAEMHTQALKRLHLENDLRQALDREEFTVYYQPIVSIQTGDLVGFEALVRWQHPIQGLVPPGDFIAIAEETGLIVPLDRWVLKTACQQLAQWNTTFPDLPALKMSVNLSAQDLWNANLVEHVTQTLEQTGLAANCLTLEITESMLIENLGTTTALLTQLKTHGIQISIDDFGTGYSSLSYLHRLPVDALKIDRSFVSQMLEGAKNHQIVETIIALSNQLEIDVIAEGIGSQAHLEALQKLGCEFGQGFFFAKPVPPEQAMHWFTSKQP